MVNRGGPSKACNECRRRKIRCSLERPQCSQCTRVGKTCPGYRSLENIIFRPYQSKEGDDSSKSETSTSQQSAGPSSNSRENFTNLEALPEFASGAAPAGPSSPQIRRVNRSVSRGSQRSSSAGRASQLSTKVLGPPSWEQQAVACFMGQFTIKPPVVTPTSGASFGWFDFLPDQYVNTGESSCLKPLVMAISYASLAGQSTLRWLMIEARKFYGIAITRINEALSVTEKATKDDVLASVLLAGFYENMVGDNLDIMGSHRAGLTMLLQLRGPAQLETERGRTLFRHVRSMYRIFNYNTGSRTMTLIEEFDRHEAESGAAESAAISELSNRVANYCADFQSFNASVGTQEDFAIGNKNFLTQGEQFKLEVLQWASSLGEDDFTGARHSSLPSLDQGPQPPFLMTYANTWRMGSSNLFRMCLIFLNEVMFLCTTGLEYPDGPRFAVEPSSQTLSSSSQTYVQETREIIEDICASMPFFLDDIDSSANLTTDSMKSGIKAFLAIWSLWIAKSSALAETRQQLYAEQALKRIGGVWGNQLAVHVAGMSVYDRYGSITKQDCERQGS